MKPSSQSVAKQPQTTGTLTRPSQLTGTQDSKPSQLNIKTTGPVLRPVVGIQNQQQIQKKGSSMNRSVVLIGAILALLMGLTTGYVLASKQQPGTTAGLINEPGLQREVTSEEIKVGTKVGLADSTTFKDSGEGTLEKGGIDGEGSHRIVRPGGASQTLYITSSVIDLDQFVGRKVKVWGETFSGQKAGWLMDVGKLEVLE